MRTSLIRATAVLAVVAMGVGLGLAGCGESDDDGQLVLAAELADAWGRGWSETDGDAVAAVFTEDGEYVSYHEGITGIGREQIADVTDAYGVHVQEVVREGDVSETEDGTFTWTVEFVFAGEPVRGMPEMELDGNLISRLWWAQEPEPIE